jgi:xylulokinase
VVGGGTAGELWTRIVCDVLGKPLQVSRVTDSAYGAALLGLVGVGLFSDVSRALAGSRQELETVSPDPERARFYTTLFQRYREIQQKLQPVYHTLAG